MEAYLQLQLLEASVGATKGDKAMEDLIKKVILCSFKDIKREARKHKTCKRKACGCVILEVNLKDDLIQHFAAMNGASGAKNKCSGIKGACGCSHSEPRAIMRYLKQRKLRIKRSYIKTILLTTFSSCVNCANIIIDSDVIDFVAYEFLATHWATPPHDAKAMLDRSLIHCSKKQLIEDKENKLLKKWRLGK